jgi:hypothetical protein
VVNTFRAATTTFDNKYLVTGSFSVNGADPHIYLYKLNYNLDYDSVYTQPFTYDSLCPHPIVSDTTDLDDCGVITDIKEPAQYEQECRLKVFPNPATDRITLELPDCIVRKSRGKWVSSMTVYHQWDQVRLDILGLNGRLVTTKDLLQAEKRVTLNVASWPRGMSLARIVFMNEVVTAAKLMLR